MRTPDELRDAVESYLGAVRLAPELGGLADAVRYALDPGGKRIRPVLCLAVTEACGTDVERALPAAAALELVHSFSLVHDDLPALDDDAERRGRPSAHVAYGEAAALLAGDALLAEAVKLALTYGDPEIARELLEATLGMIGGQYLDVTGADVDLAGMNALKTGRLLAASVGLGLRVAGVPGAEQAAWRAFGDELGQLFQVVDDILDRDGVVERVGIEEARRLAEEAAGRARDRLAAVRADTSVVAEIVDDLAVRTA